jgi:L-ascorbate metabolism protein UlaG (beta-lactamase superfamily)
MILSRTIACLFLLVSTAFADSDSRLEYLANEGVAIFHGDSTLVFDPLFRNDYENYNLVPESTREAMFLGLEPFQNITAIFVSHHHGDHFDPADMLRLMAKHESAILYAPSQAISAMRLLASDDENDTFDRAMALDLTYDDAPVLIQGEKLQIEAFFIPHAGWPNARTDVDNIAFRVAIDGLATVVHLGDADPNMIHFQRHEEQWRQASVDVALPPYWFFISRDGNQILETVIQSDHSIGIHVPTSISRKRGIPPELEAFDLFLEPGESRPLPISPK